MALPKPWQTPAVLALRGDVLVLANGKRLTCLSLSRRVLGPIIEMAWEVRELRLSLSGRFVAAAPVAAHAPNQLAVYDRQTGRLRLLSAPAGSRPRGDFTFIQHDGRELLIAALDGYSFSLLDPLSLAALSQVTTDAFRLDSFWQLNNEQIVSVGHGWGEGKNSLLVFSLTEAFTDPEACGKSIFVANDLDLGYHVFAGPFDQQSIIAYRDPEDEEDGPEDPRDAAVSRYPAYGFRGWYVRNMTTRQLSHYRDYASLSEPIDSCFATKRQIVALTATAAHLIPFNSSKQPTTTVPALATAGDPAHTRFAVVMPAGKLELYAL